MRGPGFKNMQLESNGIKGSISYIGWLYSRLSQKSVIQALYHQNIDICALASGVLLDPFWDASKSQQLSDPLRKPFVRGVVRGMTAARWPRLICWSSVIDL